MAIRKLKKSWWVDFQFNGRRYRKRSPDNTRQGADAYELLLRQNLARGEPIRDVKQPRKDQTFAEFAAKWFEDYVRPNNKFSEQRSKSNILRLSLIPFFGMHSIKEIRPYHLEQYKAELVRDGFSSKTIRNRLTVLHKCLSCAYEWLELEGSPPKTKWPRCPPLRTDYLSPEECEMLLTHADGVIYEMILTALRSGMRQGELKGLQWSSIDWETRMITVRHSYCDVRRVLDTPKSNKERHIPLDVDLGEILHKRKKKSGFVFLDGTRPFNSERVNRRLAKVCKKARLRTITWHNLRHTFASHLTMRGVPLNTVQALLGHASITTTMRYAHVAPSTLRTAIDMLNPKSIVNANFGQPAVNRWVQTQLKEVDAEISQGQKPLGLLA